MYSLPSSRSRRSTTIELAYVNLINLQGYCEETITIQFLRTMPCPFCSSFYLFLFKEFYLSNANFLQVTPRSEAQASGWLQSAVIETHVMLRMFYRRVWHRALFLRYVCTRSLGIISMTIFCQISFLALPLLLS